MSRRGVGWVALLVVAAISGTASARPLGDWRDERPKPGPAPAAPTPKIERFDLPNGLAVLVHERHDVPYVVLRAVLPAGRAAEPPGKPGLASLTCELLCQGTEQRDTMRLADDAAILGTELVTAVHGDSAEVALGSLRSTLPEALELLADVLTHPAFRQDELERTRVREQARILARADDPEQALGDVLAAVGFGDGHPYASPAFGSRDSVARISRDEIVAFYRERYRPGGAALVLVGDVTLAEARALVGKSALSTWAKAAASPLTPPPAKPQRRGIVMVDQPGAPQSQVAIVLPAVGLHDPDFIALQMASACFGETFSSRLNLNLREAHGYSYGAYGTLVRSRGPMLLAASAGVRTDATLPSVDELRRELRRLVSEPPSEAELALARAQLVHGVVGQFETMEEASRAVGELFVFDLPLDWFKRYSDAVAAIDRAHVTKAITAHVHPDGATVVIIGDAAKIEPDLAIQRRDATGKVLP